jgi:hypothetical protein
MREKEKSKNRRSIIQKIREANKIGKEKKEKSLDFPLMQVHVLILTSKNQKIYLLR